MSIFGNMFSWKSAATRKKEEEQYRRWAFPYGEKQQENLKALLKEVFSKNDGFTMFTFLSCKEMYDKALEDFESHDAAVEAMATTRLNFKMQIIKQLKKDEWLKYIALVLADKDIDENCEYPSAEEIIKTAQEIGITYE